MFERFAGAQQWDGMVRTADRTERCRGYFTTPEFFSILGVKPTLGRVFLHAARLGFAAPRTDRPVEVRAPLDPALKSYLDALAAALGVPMREVDAALRGYL